MRGRDVRVIRMQYERHADSLEILASEFRTMFGCRRRHLAAIYMRETNTGLLKYAATGQYATLAATAAGSIPSITGECCGAVELLELATNTVLQILQVLFYEIDVAQIPARRQRGRTMAPVSKCLISEGPLAGPQSPGTT